MKRKMESIINMSYIYKELSVCRNALENISDEISDNEKQRVRKGKLLLKLLSTIGNEFFFHWLRTADSAGYFYNFKEYTIVKKNTLKKDVIDIKELPRIFKAAQQLSEIDFNGESLLDRMHISDLSARGFDVADAKMLVPAFAVLLGKMANIIYEPQFQVGEIYYQTDKTNVVPDISLIDLYMIQSYIETEEEAIDELCDMKWINISKEIFQEVKFDKRTRWSNRSITFGVNPIIEDPAYEYIKFKDREQLLGNVLIDGNNIIAPQTFWSKNHNYPGRPLEIPWPGKQPLWNLDLIRGFGKQVKVILTDSLLVAYQAYKEKQEVIKRLSDELNIFKQKDRVSYYGGQDNVFEDELRECVVEKLRKEYPNFELPPEHNFHPSPPGHGYYLVEYSKARMIFRIGGHKFNFAKKLALNKNTDAFNDDTDGQLYAYLPHPFLQNSNEEIKRSVSNSSTPTGYAAPYWSNTNFNVFRTAYELIFANIDEKKKEDVANRDKIEQQLKLFKETVWSSWYGGHEAIKKQGVDFSALRNRHVYYIIRKHDKLNYETAIRCYWELKAFDSASVRFVDYETLLRKPKYEGISPEEFIESIPAKFGIDIPALEKKKTYQDQIDPISSPDIYLPDTKIDDDSFLLSPLILDRSITLMYSEQGCAKTWIALSLANAMLHGCPVFGSGIGWQADLPKRVLFIDSEMSNNSFKKRLNSLNETYRNMPKTNSHGQQPFDLEYKQVSHEDWDLTDDAGDYRDKIYKWLRLDQDKPIDCLILDNLSTLSRFNDSAKSWSNLFGWLKRISEKGCASIVLHHANKTTGDQRGSSIKSATVDNIIRVKKALPGITNNIAVNITIEKSRNTFGKALDPFNAMLKFNKDNSASWTTTMANGAKSVTNAERNRMILDVLNSGAFSQQLIADYFGINIVTLKGIAGNEKTRKEAQETLDNNKILDKILKAIENSPENKLKEKLAQIITGKSK